MPSRIGGWLWALAACAVAVPPAPACSLCDGLQGRQTFRQQAAQARLVLFGTLSNPRLKSADDALAGGTTDFHIERVLKHDPFLGERRVIEVPRYVPVDPRKPPQYLLFCDVYQNRLDPYIGMPVQSAAVVEYLKGALALDPTDSSRFLVYFFEYLDHRDTDVASDAFLEFARSSDPEIGRVAPTFSPVKLRRLLQDPATPPERLNLVAFLLGACGGEQDAALLESLIRQLPGKTRLALGGLLGGYIQLRPRAGWELAWGVLGDAGRPFPDRYAVLGMLRFLHNWKPDASRQDVLRGLELMLPQGDVADLAVEDLRRWQIWDLTAQVLAQYGKKSHDAPIVRRAILRYALACPRPEAAGFVAGVRRSEPELVQEVEESLQFEKK